MITLIELTRHVNHLTLRDHCHFALLSALLYKHRIPLLGIIYRIDLDTSCDHPFNQFLRWLEDDSYPNVVFALTSHRAKRRSLLWGRNSESTKLDVLGKQLGFGSTTARFKGTKESAIEIIERLAAISGGALSQQAGLVDQKLPLSQTGSLSKRNGLSSEAYFDGLERLTPLLLNAPAHQMIHIARKPDSKLSAGSQEESSFAIHDAAQVAAKFDHLLAAQRAARSVRSERRLDTEPSELSGKEKLLLEQRIVQAIELPDNEVKITTPKIPRLPELEGSPDAIPSKEQPSRDIALPRQASFKLYNEPWRALAEDEKLDVQGNYASVLVGGSTTDETSDTALMSEGGSAKLDKPENGTVTVSKPVDPPASRPEILIAPKIQQSHAPPGGSMFTFSEMKALMNSGKTLETFPTEVQRPNQELWAKATPEQEQVSILDRGYQPREVLQGVSQAVSDNEKESLLEGRQGSSGHSDLHSSRIAIPSFRDLEKSFQQRDRGREIDDSTSPPPPPPASHGASMAASSPQNAGLGRFNDHLQRKTGSHRQHIPVRPNPITKSIYTELKPSEIDL